MDVASVGSEERAALEEASDDREQGIDDGKTKR